MTQQRVILLDRDGVLNQDRSDYVRSPEQFQMMEGTCQAIARLTQAHYRILIITNQACLGKGLVSPEMLEKIHAKMINEVQRAGGCIDQIFHCPHIDQDRCGCRKPKPGLILQARERWAFQPEETWFVGDSLRDLQTADAAGCLGALVLTGHGAETAPRVKDHPHFNDLAHFVDFLLDD